jgi:hypothetical protein
MQPNEIRELFNKFGADLERDDVWTVQSATVIKHRALERLAAAAKVTFAAPQVLRAEREEAVILATGTLGERSEWSIGEALVNVNYRISGKMAAYVYAMAEKRAKDRVILKLTGLHGLYSEDEADEFKERQSAPPPPQPSVADRLIAKINEAESAVELGAWWQLPAVQIAWKGLHGMDAHRVDDARKARLKALESDFPGDT